MRGSSPPRCASHGGALVGAPEGNSNAEKHGYYSAPTMELNDIGDVLEDVFNRQAQLSAYIQEKSSQGGVELADMIKLLTLHGQNASRIGRLLRDQRALSGDAADGLLGALGTLFDEVNSELGSEWDL
jgi:hypothetical protein